MGALTVMLAGWGMVLAARGLGEWALRPFKVAAAPRLTQALWAIGLGLGVISLGTLGLGLAGLPRAGLGLCALGLLLGVRPFARDLAAAREGVRGFRWASWNGSLLAVCLIVFVGTVFFALLPQCDYDVLEYHLGAPMHYLRLGAVEHLPWNVYASFPENTEMLYLCLLALFGGAMKGGMAAAALNVAVGVLCAVAVADLARALFGARAAVPAAALFYTYPITWVLSGKCYVEMEQVLFSVLCVRALVGEDGRRAALAGALAGLAMGAKYPAAVFLSVPIGLFVLGAKGFRAAGAFALVAMLVVSPWLAKNLVATGNPVYPLLGAAFRTEGWTQDQEARFVRAHRPPPTTTADAGAELLVAISGSHPSEDGEVVWTPPSVALVVLVAPLLLVFPLEGVSRRRAVALLLLTAWHAMAWWLWTHRIDRFFYPAVPWLAVVGAGAIAGLSNEFVRNAAKFAAAVLIWFHGFWGAPNVVASAGVVDFEVRGGEPWEFLTAFNDQVFEPMKHLNDGLPSDARVLLVGEAQTFYLERDFVAATVFDDCPWEDLFPVPPANAAQAREVLRAKGITHVFVSWPEVRRLRRSYQYVLNGATRPGYPEAISPQVFRMLEGGALEKVSAFGPVVPELGCEVVVLYRVRAD